MFFEIQCTEPTKWVAKEEEEVTKILNGQYIKWGASSASIDIVLLRQSNSKESFHVGLYDYESKEATDHVSYETRVQYLESDEIVQGTKHLRTIIQKGALTINVSEKSINVRVHVSDCSQRLGYLIFCLGVYNVESPEHKVYSLPFLVGTKSRSIGKHPVLLSVPMTTIRELRGEVERPKKRRCITPTVLSSSETEDEEPNNASDTPPSGSSSGSSGTSSDTPSGWKAYANQSNAKLLQSIQKQHKDTLEKMDAMMEKIKHSLDALQQQISERTSPSNNLVDFSQLDCGNFDFTLGED